MLSSFAISVTNLENSKYKKKTEKINPTNKQTNEIVAHLYKSVYSICR